MTATLATFRLIAPEFSGTSDDTVSGLLSLCSGWITASVFGARAGEAVARLAAHELTMQARRTAAAVGSSGVGGVTSLRAGDLSVSYGAALGAGSAANNHQDDDYRQTSHGLAFLNLRDSRAEVRFGVLA